MPKSTFTRGYELFRARLVEMRRAAGMSQRDLAAALGREHSFAGRTELGERRVDVVEFYWICRACGVDPARAAAELMREIATMEARRGKRHGGR